METINCKKSMLLLSFKHLNFSDVCTAGDSGAFVEIYRNSNILLNEIVDVHCLNVSLLFDFIIKLKVKN